MKIAVVGAGWSGLAVATFLRERGADVTVLEAAPRPGGRIRTHAEDGYLVEHGPHGLIAASDASRRLLDAAGVPMVEAPPRAPRFVLHGGRPVALPASPPAILTTSLLTRVARARLFLEPLRGAGPPGETVGALVRRRLGEGVSHLADAFVTGVYAGDPDRLVAAHAFPELARMDREGGLFRSLRRARGRTRPPLASPAEGMEALAAALAARLDVRTAAPVERVVEKAGRVEVSWRGGSGAYDKAVLALDPPAVAKLLGLDAPAPPSAPVAVAAFGVPADAAPREGYGVLAPEREGRFVLGALYESVLFPGRAPPGMALVRCLVGGRRHPERAHLPGEEMARLAWRDLRDAGLVRGEPARVFTLPPQEIPQPEAGHDRWLAALPKGRVRALGIGHAAVGLDPLAAQARALAEELTRA